MPKPLELRKVIDILKDCGVEFDSGGGDLLEKDRTDALQLLEIFREAGRRAGAPTAIVIDEFGKNLEFMARYPGEATFIFCN